MYWCYTRIIPIFVMTPSNGNIFRVTGLLCGEFTGYRWRGALMFPLICPNKRWSKQSLGWWFETPSRSLWRHRNVLLYIRTSRVPAIPLSASDACTLKISRDLAWHTSRHWLQNWGVCLDIKLSSYQYINPPVKDKTVLYLTRGSHTW